MIQILQPDHSLLRGLRILVFGDNTKTIQNRALRGGGRGVTSGGPTLTNIKGWPAIVGDKVDNLITFDTYAKYFGTTSRDITVIGRMRSNSSHFGIIAGTGLVAGGTAGWNFTYSNFGSGETGYNFAVRSAAGHWMEVQDGVGDSNIVGKTVVFAGIYDSRRHVVSAFLRNEGEGCARLRNPGETNNNSGNTLTEDWDIRGGTSPFVMLAPIDLGAPFDGSVAWLAVFDRVLGYDEIAAWSRDEEWPFAEDYPITTVNVAHFYASQILANQSAGYSQLGSARREANFADVAPYLSGDLVTGSDATGPKLFTNVVGAAGSETVGQPLLKKYANVVSVAGVESRGLTQQFNNVVGVRQKARDLIDGRVDILATTGYRR